MENAPDNLLALCMLCFALGLRHGMDPDHLATIDGLTRFNIGLQPRLARWCGALFSLGHGAVVISIALVVSLLAGSWQTPPALIMIGAWISIAFLAVLGVANLWIAIRAQAGTIVQPAGLRGRLLGRLSGVSSPLAVAFVGVLFAVSFDTISQASLFAVMASRFSGIATALLLGVLFTGGMLLVDGGNGLWIARLLRQSDRRAALASRVISFVVAFLSLGVAALGALRLASATVAQWSEGKELLLGFAVVAVVGVSFVAALAASYLVNYRAGAPSQR